MAGKKKNVVSGNYLDYIPVYDEKHQYEVNDKGEVTILVENTGIFNRIAQTLLKKPKVSKIHLDEMGNFIWPLIDGKNTIYDISVHVKEQFGDKAEPLYNRLVQYMRNLESYGFVRLKKSGD